MSKYKKAKAWMGKDLSLHVGNGDRKIFDTETLEGSQFEKFVQMGFLVRVGEPEVAPKKPGATPSVPQTPAPGSLGTRSPASKVGAGVEAISTKPKTPAAGEVAAAADAEAEKKAAERRAVVERRAIEAAEKAAAKAAAEAEKKANAEKKAAEKAEAKRVAAEAKAAAEAAAVPPAAPEAPTTPVTEPAPPSDGAAPSEPEAPAPDPEKSSPAQ